MTFMGKFLDKLNVDNWEGQKSNTDFEEAIGNEITAYFRNGKMYKVSPSDTENWYNSRFIVSDEKLYDLENIEDIKRIPIPTFKKPETDNYGVTGQLDYVLRAKSRIFYDKREKELCSACLWKATEMMFCNPLCSWSKKDYIRLIHYHLWLEMKDEAERAQKYLENKGMIFTEYELQGKKFISSNTSISHQTSKRVPKEKIDWREKELITVKNITINDMRELETMPFVCNTDIKKYIHEGNHPFAYMEITGENFDIVKAEITKMNDTIADNIKHYPKIPQQLRIPVDELLFHSSPYGFTRIMCTPKTYEGAPSQYPYTLYFCTDLSKRENTTHGELTYGQDGTVEKSDVVFWRNHNQFVLNFKTVNGVLTLLNLGQSRPTW
jgi:hypothetical protein